MNDVSQMYICCLFPCNSKIHRGTRFRTIVLPANELPFARREKEERDTRAPLAHRGSLPASSPPQDKPAREGIKVILLDVLPMCLVEVFDSGVLGHLPLSF